MFRALPEAPQIDEGKWRKLKENVIAKKIELLRCVILEFIRWSLVQQNVTFFSFVSRRCFHVEYSLAQKSIDH